MSNKVSIIEYHYVRDLKNSRYPEIKGLDVGLFKKQLDFILKHYWVIRMEDLIEAVQFKKKLPENALLLTFDDGYRDHFEFVFPILNSLGLQGSFFPPVLAVEGRKVLDVNKIHFVLASVSDKKQIIKDLFALLDIYRKEYALEENSYYYNKLAKPGRFDPKEVVFIKIMLQKELPEKLRQGIADLLFKKYVSSDEKSFSRELYMDTEQIKLMKKNGMYFGSHGFDHYWLDALAPEKQEREIDMSLKFLKEIGCDISAWVKCYPYGTYNDSLVNILKEKKCALGLIEGGRVADLDRDDPLLLPRVDTKDLL